MEPINQFQRYETSYRLLANDFSSAKDELSEIKKELSIVLDENKNLRRELKESLKNQIAPFEAGGSGNTGLSEIDKNAVLNMETQIKLLKNERENAIQMWQNSLLIITKLEQDLKNLQFATAPQTMSFELELRKRQEEFSAIETKLLKELSLVKVESSKKDEDIMELKLKETDLKMQIENLKSQLSQQVHDRRSFIKKEYGYDDALISLQNDINDLETKIISITKDNDYLKESIRESKNKINELLRVNADLEFSNSELKRKIDENNEAFNIYKIENQKVGMIAQKQIEDHDHLHDAISALMSEAEIKTKNEVEALRKMYNNNIEKLIEECSFLENDRNDKAVHLEKALRIKKTLEDELEKISNENIRMNNKENLMQEDLHRRLCIMEKEKDQALAELEAKKMELKKYQSMYETERERNTQKMSEFNEKSNKISFELERFSHENVKLITEKDELKHTISTLTEEKDSLQKSLTKQIQLHEKEIQIKTNENLNRTKCLEENHSRSIFEIRQLLNMQQRMSNKWKADCIQITNESETKFAEMKRNFDNLRSNNEKLYSELNDFKRRELEHENTIKSYQSKVKTLESRVRDAEYQANEATKRISKQMARDKIMDYERHLMESEFKKNNLNDFQFDDQPTKLKN